MAYGNALSALADPTRRHVMESLRSGPRAVGDIARGMPVSRPAVSQHLKVLKEAGLVTDRAEGTRRVYYIDPKGLAALRAWLDQFWDQALAAFQDRSGKILRQGEAQMTKTFAIAPVRKSLVVNASRRPTPSKSSRAGSTAGGPRAHGIGATPVKQSFIEPRKGGRWYTTHEDGSETVVGHMHVWEPPHRIVFSWEVSAELETRSLGRVGSRNRLHRRERRHHTRRARTPQLRSARPRKAARRCAAASMAAGPACWKSSAKSRRLEARRGIEHASDHACGGRDFWLHLY